MIDFKLKNIIIHNFACYYGLNTLNFTNDSEKNIFLFDLPNGYGKTSLFHAIKWGFYGDDIEYYKDSDRVYVEDFFCDMADITKDVCFVEINFVYGNHDYSLTRKYQPSISKSSTFLLSKDGEGINDINEAQEELANIIPINFADFFMFDGERLSRFMTAQKEFNYKDSVHQLLGLKQIRILKDDLSKLQSKYENELVRQNTTNKEVDFLLKTVEGINKEISNLEEKIIKYESENSQNDEYIDKLEDQRKNYENLPKIFLELNDINDKILKLNVDITKIKTNLENNSKYFFTNILNKDLNDIIENNNDRINYLKDICGLNDLQAEYQAAREDIIKKSIPKCSVCGHTLSDKEIESLKNELDTIKSRLIQFNQNKKERDLLKDENDLYNEFLDIIEKFDYQYELDELYKKTSTLEALKKRKRELDLEGQKEEYGSLSDINKQISSLEQDITTNINHIEICREKIKGYKKKKDENLREIKKLSHNNTMTDNITNRITHITKLIQQLNEALELGTRSKRDKILAESNSLFNDITNKPQEYSGIDFESPDSYAFIIKKKDGKTVTKPSKGEKQVLAMSFLLGLSQYTGRNNVILMDTPVASLDDVHSAGIGKALANLDNQVIFLAQPQELNGDIYKNMKKRIAKQFNVIRDEYTSKFEEANI